MSQEKKAKKKKPAQVQAKQPQQAASSRKRPAPRQPRGSSGKLAAQIVASVVVVAIAGYACFSMYRSLTPISQGTDNQDLTMSIPSAEESTEPATEARIYENIAVDQSEMSAGSLILVNDNYGYTQTDPEEIVNIYEYRSAHGIESYHITGSELSLREDALAALSEMLDAFYVATGNDDIIINEGYRTHEQQQKMYDADLAETGQETSDRVALPGHSEHETGYAVNLSIYQEGQVYPYDGTGDYAWINENCDKYGYILRYSADKADVTGLDGEPDHYRYVGQPHATYIMDNDLCLEEYILLLTSYTSDNPLRITNWDGEIYEVYYVPADPDADSTYVMVPPDQDYTISGNNANGFIVTVDTGEIRTYQETEDNTDLVSDDAAGDDASSVVDEDTAVDDA